MAEIEPYLVRREAVKYAQGSQAVQAETTIIAAEATFALDLVFLSLVARGGANTVTIRDATGGTARLVIALAASETQILPFAPVFIPQTTKNANWTMALSAATAVEYMFVVIRRNIV